VLDCDASVYRIAGRSRLSPVLKQYQNTLYILSNRRCRQPRPLGVGRAASLEDSRARLPATPRVSTTASPRIDLTSCDPARDWTTPVDDPRVVQDFEPNDLEMIDKHYGHFACDSREHTLALPNAAASEGETKLRAVS